MSLDRTKGMQCRREERVRNSLGDIICSWGLEEGHLP